MTTFAQVLARQAATRSEKTAVVAGRRRLSYARLDGYVGEVAGRLRSAGVREGSVVSSQLPNGIEALALCFAVNRLGAVHNPITTIYRRRELDFILDQAGSVAFVDAVDHPRLRGGGTPEPVHPPGRPRARRFLLYTSGSTADPKGALHSDRTLVAECAAQASYHGLTDDEVFVMPSPVAHISGLLYGILLPVWLGATSVLMDRWDPGRFLELVERERGTFSGGATPFLEGAVDHPDLDRYDTSSLRLFPCGGADVPPALIRRAIRRLGIRTGRGYGSTEFPSITSSAGPDEPEDKRAETDGRPIGANEVRIHDGEIQARGPELFLGYLDAGLDGAAFTDDGWFRTGDLGAIDDDGYLVVSGRVKDIVIRRGEKISARELENLLAAHPKVATAAVVAVPDARTGERACVCVVPRSPADPPTLAELTAFLVGQQLSRRKLPEQLVVVDALPLTASGKVDKQALRSRLEGRAGRVGS